MNNKELAGLIHNELVLMGADLPYTTTTNIIESVLDESNSGGNAGYSEPVSQGDAVAETLRVYQIPTEEGTLILNKESVLSHLDAELDLLKNGGTTILEITRMDMTEKEIDGLPEI